MCSGRRQTVRSFGLALVASAAMICSAAAACPNGIVALKKGANREALTAFHACAERGDAEAQFEIGQLFYGSSLGAPDYGEAAAWYLRAAEQGHMFAQGSIGALYAAGKGVEKDLVQAHKWLSLAVDQGYTGARYLRDGFVSEMTAEEIAEARALAQEWSASR